MPKSETLHIIGISLPLESESAEAIVYAANKQTGQMSFEPLESISINNRSINTQFFSARSLERRIRGYYSAETPSQNKGEIDIVTPLSADEFEQF